MGTHKQHSESIVLHNSCHMTYFRVNWSHSLRKLSYPLATKRPHVQYSNQSTHVEFLHQQPNFHPASNQLIHKKLMLQGSTSSFERSVIKNCAYVDSHSALQRNLHQRLIIVHNPNTAKLILTHQLNW